MYIKKLQGQNFRKFDTFKFYFNPLINIIIGQNGVGKTSLLETIFFTLAGEGFRERKEIELLKFEKEFFQLEAEFSGEEVLTIKIVGKKENSSLQKTFFLNKTKRKLSELKKILPWPILFTPEDLKIANADPEIRRNYLNKLLSKLFPKYKSALLNYENALKRRNKILQQKEISIEKIEEELKFWNDYLEKNSKEIISQRKLFIDFCNQNKDFFGRKFSISYSSNPFTKGKSQKLREKELELGYTLLGPHREDFEMFLQKDNLEYSVKIYGSRSEQRLAVLWLKNNEALFIMKILKENYKRNSRPIFLLDDVFSELDPENRKTVLKIVKTYQTFITTSYPEVLDEISLPYHTIILKN